MIEELTYDLRDELITKLEDYVSVLKPILDENNWGRIKNRRVKEHVSVSQ